MSLSERIKNIFGKNLLFLILIVILIKGVIFSLIIPLWQIPDEEAHFGYIQYLVEEKKLQKNQNAQSSDYLTVSEELGESAKLLNFEKLSSYSRKLLVDENKDKTLLRNVNNEKYKNPATIYPPLYYFLGSFLYLIFYNNDILIRAMAIRFLSVVFFLLIIYFFYKSVLLIRNNKLFATTVCILIGFNPMLTFLFSGINVDVLLIFLSTMTIYYCLKLIREGVDTKKSLILGLLLGAGLLTKPTFVFFIPLIFFAYIFFIKAKTAAMKLKYLSITYCFGFLVSFLWYLKYYLIYGSISGIVSDSSVRYSIYSDRSIFFYIKLIFFNRYIDNINSFWGIFGWVNIQINSIFYIILFFISFMAFLGIIYYLFINLYQYIKNKAFKNDLIKYILFLLLSILFLDILLSCFYINTVINYGSYSPLQGRYYFPIILPFFVLLVVGLERLISKKLYNHLYIILCLGMIIFNFYCLFNVLIPFYYL